MYNNFPGPKATSLNVLFCLMNIVKPKYIHFTIILDKDKQEIPESAHVLHFSLKRNFD